MTASHPFSRWRRGPRDRIASSVAPLPAIPLNVRPEEAEAIQEIMRDVPVLFKTGPVALFRAAP